jgi:hypothetical protein
MTALYRNPAPFKAEADQVMAEKKAKKAMQANADA